MQIPKDRQIIIITETGKCVAIWSPADKAFACANLQIDMFEGKWNMKYYENMYIKEENISAWREL